MAHSENRGRAGLEATGEKEREVKCKAPFGVAVQELE
jgi:hypothetical protein